MYSNAFSRFPINTKKNLVENPAKTPPAGGLLSEGRNLDNSPHKPHTEGGDAIWQTRLPMRSR